MLTFNKTNILFKEFSQATNEINHTLKINSISDYIWSEVKF